MKTGNNHAGHEPRNTKCPFAKTGLGYLKRN